LTAAELIGATSGLGWYVKYHSDFANYTKVVAGIIVIGVVVTALNRALLALEKVLIKWK
jgi:NitT/TauT family transport system permease protein